MNRWLALTAPPKKPKRDKPADQEFPIQCAIVRFLRTALPRDWIVMHIPNNPRSAVHGKRLKEAGLLRGAPDILIVGPYEACECIADNENRAGVWWGEVKAPHIRDGKGKIIKRGGSVSSDQRAMHDKLKLAGGPVGVWTSIDDAQASCEDWGLPIMVRRRR